LACDARPGAEQRTTTVTVTDHARRTVTLAAPARRVISLMPAVTDMILALGANDRLIARTQFDSDPRIAALPSTGNALNPSLEWIAALEPDLVIAWPDQPSRAVVSRLSTMGIPVYSARTSRLPMCCAPRVTWARCWECNNARTRSGEASSGSCRPCVPPLRRGRA
jgi:iron complex transport system substrate-binding protein